MKYGRFITVILLLSLVIPASLPKWIVQADTYEVVNANNNGPGSLRQAISDANNHPGPDTIIFQQNDKGFFISLTGPGGEDANVSGDLDILDGGDLTILGNGTINTTIDGGGIDRVFHICPGVSCSNTVTISGVSIQNGYVTSDGGGVLNEGATVIIQNSAVGKAGYGNSAVEYGGGICNSSGTMIVNNTMINANIGTNGGGISNSSTLTVQNGSLIGEVGAANFGYIGGGIYNDAGTTTVYDSLLTANDADYGGGIFNFSGTVTLDGSTVSANTAQNDGGGVYNNAVLNVVNDSAIGIVGAGNEAEYGGGGILNFSGTVTLDGSTVSDNNVVDGNGGGIYNRAELTVQNGSTIGGTGAGNSADHGAGIYNDDNGEITVGASFVSANMASLNGGGIYINSGTLTINNSSVYTNFADNGGGIYNKGELTVQNGSTIGANTARVRGGGIFCATEALTINASSITDNDANDLGGGIFNNVSCDVTVDDSTISSNEASDGGGIYNFGTLTIQNNSAVSANESNNGGGIYTLGILIIQNNSTIGGSESTGNQALSGHGGGIYNDDGGTTMVGTSFVNANSASQNGGGIYIDSGTLTFNNSSINENSAQNGGGFFNDGGTLMVQNGSTIGGDAAGNSAENNGGGIYNNGWVTVVGSTIGRGNTAVSGGGIYNNATTTVTGSRIINNTVTTTGGGVYNNANTAGATSVMSSCIVSNSVAAYDNNQPSEQIATGNWWGAPTGPNTPGADTVSGNVDTSGFLTSPILDCTSDLEVSKTNDIGGNVNVGDTFQWTLIISNTGLINATFDAGEMILIDDLPVGASYTAPVVGNIVGVDNYTNIHCSIASNSLSCAAQGGNVTLGSVTGHFEVAFTVTPLLPGTLVNPAGICQVDPSGVVVEINETNNNCAVNVVDVYHNIFLPLVLR